MAPSHQPQTRRRKPRPRTSLTESTSADENWSISAITGKSCCCCCLSLLTIHLRRACFKYSVLRSALSPVLSFRSRSRSRERCSICSSRALSCSRGPKEENKIYIYMLDAMQAKQQREGRVHFGVGKSTACTIYTTLTDSRASPSLSVISASSV